MGSAQDMEEQLQQSVLLSEESRDYDTADSPGDGSTINAASYDINPAINTTTNAFNASTRPSNDVEEEPSDQDQDASGDEIDEDAEGEDNDEFLEPEPTNGDVEHTGTNGAAEDDNEEDEEEEEEGVGAVKIKPGETDNEEDDESEVTDLPSAADDDSEEEAAWDEGVAEDEDEESEVGAPNTCIFCKQDEENDPSEDFEAFLGCSGCGEHAHQQCAREAAAMSERNNAKRWRCPECHNDEASEDDFHNEEIGSGDETARPMSRHSDVPKLARDLLPARRSSDPDSHSVFDELVLDEDPQDGTRLLRKRKTSSLEPDEHVISLRKRRRNTQSDNNPTQDEAMDSSVDASKTQSARSLRLKSTRQSAVTIEKRTRNALVLKMQVRSGNLKEVLTRRRRGRKRAEPSAPKPARTPAPARVNTVPAPILQTPFTSDSYSQPFYSFFDKDMGDANGKPYGGILTEAEADTSKTIPMSDDRRRFDQAKQKAEDEWRARVLAIQAESDAPTRKSKKVTNNGSQIECIEFGGWEIDTWYAAPYPAEYSRNRVLYICEFCLKYMNSDYVAWRHKLKCGTKHPPGDEIYRHGSVSVFEVDGRKNPVYCQNLCLLAKLFLGSKTLYYDVEPFLFYVLCEYDDCGYHFVGYFSKEKRASSQNNVSCILTLPIHQRKGYGNLLIDFSYLLTRVEEKTGSPEKPLSDMGLVSYRNYWRLILCRYFIQMMDNESATKPAISVKGISDETGMTADDVISALEGLRALVRDPQTKLYAFRVDVDYCRTYVEKWESKGYVKLKPEALVWTPYVMGRSNAVNFELGPPISTIAPREEDEAKLQEGGIIGTSMATDVIMEEAEDAVPPVEEAAVVPTEVVVPPAEATESIADKALAEDKENVITNGEPMEDVKPEQPVTLESQYAGIPPTRFEIFPPVTGGRRAERARASVSRPPAARPPSVPRPKRASGGSSVRRATPARPKASAARRKSGGTGRGPGRWPKGTKKSDYGNADSGPGLPPGWKEKQQARDLASGGGVKAADNGNKGTGDEQAKDEVQVSVSASPLVPTVATTLGGPANGLPNMVQV